MLSFKNLQQVYALLICLVSMVVLLVSMGNLLDDATRLLFSSYRQGSELLKFQSNEAYLRYYNFENNEEKQEVKKLTPEKLTERRPSDQQHFLKADHFRALESLIKTIQWILVAFIFFCIHWKLYKRSHEK